MSVDTVPRDLPTRVQQLLELRDQHFDALTKIDATLAQIGSALGGGQAVASAPRSVAPMAYAPAAKKPSRRGRRSGFATTAEESVMAFISQNRNPSTSDIKGLWDSEGRGGKADNLLSRLVKDKKLKRLPFEGGRGSRYAIA